MVNTVQLLTGAQLRAARALLRLSAEKLAAETLVSLRTISRAESVDGQTALTGANALRLIKALMKRGVVFVDGGDEGPGVRLRRNSPPRFGND